MCTNIPLFSPDLINKMFDKLNYAALQEESVHVLKVEISSYTELLWRTKSLI